MKGIMLCDINGKYRGVARSNSIPDYFENKDIGSILQEFLAECVDAETQEIIFRLNNIARASIVVNALKSIGCDSEVLVYCDVDEYIDVIGVDFAGYDVASEAFLDSPLQLGLLDDDIGSSTYHTYLEFFKNTDGIVLDEYSNNLNELVLFAEKQPAIEIAEYCTWLTERREDLFEGGKNYKAVKVYIVKQ